VGTVMAGIDSFGDYRVLLLPDHPTPVEKMTHTKDPVPFVLCGSGKEFAPENNAVAGYSEAAAKESGLLIDPGHKIMNLLVSGTLS